MEFNPVNGFDISRDFFDSGKCCYEAEIESEIHHALKKVCKYIKVRKSKLGLGITDGIIKLYKEDGSYLGFIINETKRDQPDRLEAAMIQGMFYAGTFLYDVSFDSEINSDKFLGFFLTTAFEFVFVPTKEADTNTFIYFWDRFGYLAPNVATKEAMRFRPTFTFRHLFKLDETFRLDLLIKDIYEGNY